MEVILDKEQRMYVNVIRQEIFFVCKYSQQGNLLQQINTWLGPKSLIKV